MDAAYRRQTKVKKRLAKGEKLCYDIRVVGLEVKLNRSRPVGMADEVDSKSIDGNIVRVQVPRPALLGRGKTVEDVWILRFFFLSFIEKNGLFNTIGAHDNFVCFHQLNGFNPCNRFIEADCFDDFDKFDNFIFNFILTFFLFRVMIILQKKSSNQSKEDIPCSHPSTLPSISI